MSYSPAHNSTIGSLCTGIGGLDIAVAKVFNAQTRWVSEIDPAACTVIENRIGALNLGDLRSFAVRPSPVDIITAGFPCQDLSAAGKKAGLNGPKSKLWFDVLKVIAAQKPQWVVIENVPRLHSTGALDVVLAGLEQNGYGGSWCFYRSGYYTKNPSGFAHVGAPHQRKRLFILAERGRSGFEQHHPTGWTVQPAETVADLPATPTAWLGRRPSHSDLSNPGAFETLTRDIAKLLPTPAASRSGSNQGGAAGRVGPKRRSLDSVQKLLRTPTTTRRDITQVANDRGVSNGSWGEYAAAIARWEAIHGPAPQPAIDNKLNPALPEWMMGYPSGWVTDLDIPRTGQLRIIGNAVQPQVAEAALASMLGSRRI